MKYVLIFLLFYSVCESQNASKIIGKWTGTKKETLNGRTRLNDGRIIKELTVYEFTDKTHLIDYTFKPTLSIYTYVINKDILKFSKLCFKIIKLTDLEMVLQDYDPDDPTNPLVFKHYYTKSKPLK